MNGIPVHVSNEVLAIIVTVATIIVTTIIFLISRRRRRGKIVTLVGLCDSGKTLLLSRIVNGKFVKTYTSMTENKSAYQIDKSFSLELVDIPGHERLRERIFNKYKDQLRAVVVVVDSVNFTAEYRDVAALLYDLLASWHHKQTPLLIACNKQDLLLAKSCDTIKSELEAEITLVRKSQLAALQGMEGGKSGKKKVEVGKQEKDFEFSDVHPIRVEFVGCSGLGKDEQSDADIDNIAQWLNKLK